MSTQLTALNHSSGPPLLPFDLDTLPKIFFDSIDRRPRPDAFRFKQNGEWKSLSHPEVEKRVAAFAAALAELGIQRGDRVAVLSENRPEWAIADYAVLGLGAIYVPIYSTLPSNQIAFILADCETKAILVSTREQHDKIAEIKGEVPSLRQIISFDELADLPDVLSFDALIGRAAAANGASGIAKFRQQALSVESSDIATLIYTSGTMGDPKGVMLTHANLTSNVAAVKAHQVIDEQPGDVGLSFLPLSHVLERMVDYYYWSVGICIAYAESIEKVADNLVEIHPNYMVSVPRLFEKIYTRVMGATGVKRALVMWAKKVGEEFADLELAGQTPGGAVAMQYRIADKLVFSKLRSRTGGRLRAAISGGAPLSGDVARFFFAAGLPVYEGYGLTETSPVLTANRPGKVKLGTVGQAVAGTEIRIDASGEIVVRGPQIMKGYWNRPDATAECVDDEGWFRTGDVGTIDEDGFLRITDRIKNIIVTAGGKNIAPQPIENEVALSPYVAQVVMLGDRRAYPTLLIVPDFDNLSTWAQGQGIDIAERSELVADPRVRQFLEQEVFGRMEGLARHERPKKIALVPAEFTVDTGELTPSLKVKRRVVEAKYADLITGLYEE
jgi:long-chain acyl-CoA synthetase